MGLFATILLVAQASLAAPVEHKPVEKVVRGQPIVIKATIHGLSPSFSPLVFARAHAKGRFFGYPMSERGKDQWVARLPQSVAAGSVFDYFIESRLATGERLTSGSQEKPFQVTVEDAVILPARVEVNSDAGAVVSLDGKVQGEAPQTIEAPPGKHTISVTLGDGRGAEQTVEFTAGKTRTLKLAPASASGPGRMTVNSEPHGARVYLDGKPVGTTPFVGDVSPGEHTLAVEADGFLRQERQVSGREGRDMELSFALLTLPKDPALSIESVPAGATVLIDGVAKGTAPWLGPLSAGRHEVVLKLAGHRETASDFEMPEGRDLALRLELTAAQGPANSAPQVLVGSRPDGATVKIDGAEVGTTPWQGEVKAGAHTVAVSLDGFVAEERQVTAHNNREADVDFVLQRPPGPARLTIESDPMGADITVDGQVVGTTPLAQEVSLEAGEHQVEARRAGFVSVAQTVTVEQAQTASLRLAMAPAPKEPLPPTIAVSTEPSGARLYVDGKLAGETPYRLKSKPGPHELKLVLDGYVSRSAKVKLPEDSGFELRVAATMHRSRGSDQVERPDAVAIARGQLKRAQACYKLADYTCALTNYKAVYAVKPVPELIFNVGQSYRRLGQLKEASAAFRTYVKEKPDGPLAKQAEQLAQQCDDALARGESKVAEDDNTPPVLHHTSPGKVVRGQAVTLTAVITDDKSGVEGPPACFTTLFQSEFSCPPLLPSAAKDEYTVTL
ncbi:MAG: PEGA domain-containing protein, partial [Deltaproteobacteria bacterium]|nr:PEGA domain-containing protein [Deltaproteobacteria bacterium]